MKHLTNKKNNLEFNISPFLNKNHQQCLELVLINLYTISIRFYQGIAPIHHNAQCLKPKERQWNTLVKSTTCKSKFRSHQLQWPTKALKIIDTLTIPCNWRDNQYNKWKNNSNSITFILKVVLISMTMRLICYWNHKYPNNKNR